jgi:hypothetical protein
MGEVVENLQEAPKMDQNSFPETRYIVTEADISNFLQAANKSNNISRREEFGAFTGGDVGFAHHATKDNNIIVMDMDVKSGEPDTEAAKNDQELKELMAKMSPLEKLEFENLKVSLKYTKRRYFQVIVLIFLFFQSIEQSL